MIPNGIIRRKKTAPSKLTKELVIYRLLYMDWKIRQNQYVSERNKPGLSVSEIETFCQVSPRMLTRYLRELRDCKAIRSVRKKGLNYLAEFDGYAPCDHLYECDPGATPHLLKLSRTATLMRKWLENDDIPPTDYPNSNVGVFFWRLKSAENWYGLEACFDTDNPRTIQRDVRDVLEVLKITDADCF